MGGNERVNEHHDLARECLRLLRTVELSEYFLGDGLPEHEREVAVAEMRVERQ